MKLWEPTRLWGMWEVETSFLVPSDGLWVEALETVAFAGDSPGSFTRSCDRVLLIFLGLLGPKGEMGEAGITGAEGPRGFPGTPGRKGEPGEGAYVYRSAFSVGLENRVTVPNVPIRFTKIFYNQQNHYDGSTGKFHCNIAGLYYFSYHITVYMKDVKVSLFKKDKAVLFTYDQYQEKNVDQASGSVLLHLEVGDQVWLQVYGEGDHNGLYADNVNDSTFTGFLLYHDTN